MGAELGGSGGRVGERLGGVGAGRRRDRAVWRQGDVESGQCGLFMAGQDSGDKGTDNRQREGLGNDCNAHAVGLNLLLLLHFCCALTGIRLISLQIFLWRKTMNSTVWL